MPKVEAIIDDELYARMQEVIEARGVSRAALIKEALTLFVDTPAGTPGASDGSPLLPEDLSKRLALIEAQVAAMGKYLVFASAVPMALTPEQVAEAAKRWQVLQEWANELAAKRS